MAKAKPQYRVCVDSRERTPWTFENTESCSGWVKKALPTGDYSIEGWEDAFVIERKGSTGEIAKNVGEARFTRELERLSRMAHPFIVCEFTVADILMFPVASGIPRKRWGYIKMRGPYLLRRLSEFMVNYGVPIIFAGPHGKEVALSLFKRIAEAAQTAEGHPCPPAAP